MPAKNTNHKQTRYSAGIRTLKVNKHTLLFEVIYSSRRTLGISVNRAGEIVARAPQGVSLQQIDRFMTDHANWIVKQQRRAADRRQEQPVKLTYKDGETLYLLGKPLQLQVITGKNGSIQVSDGAISVAVKADANAGAVERAVMRWYRLQAEALFNERLALQFARVRHWKVTPLPLAIRRMKTRWGSCNSKGKITLSLRLMQAPVELIDYVILHELCHLREMNHGRGFYKLLAEICPDWRVRKSALKLTPTNW